MKWYTECLVQQAERVEPTSNVLVDQWLERAPQVFGLRKRHDLSDHGADDAALLRKRVVRLRGLLGDGQAKEVIARLLLLQQEDPREPITLRIDSQGGSLTAALAVVDTLDELSSPVRGKASDQ